MPRYVFLIFLLLADHALAIDPINNPELYNYRTSTNRPWFPDKESACIHAASLTPQPTTYVVSNTAGGRCELTWPTGSGFVPLLALLKTSFCSGGLVYDFATQSCDDCPDGATVGSSGQCECSNGLAFVNSSNQLQRCMPFDDDQLCTNSWDLFTSYNCQKKKDDCLAEGGTFGWVGGKSTCLPSDYLAEQPVCSGDYTVVDNGNGSGGVVCTPAGTPPEPITPPENPDAPPPVTGENNQNGVGNNTNGDGAAGSGQTTTTDNGDGTQTTESNNAAAGGSGCGAPPSCSGDPILCNILKQEYESKCAMNTFSPSKLGNLPSPDQIKSTENVTGFFDDIFNDNGVTSACPSPRSLSFTNQQFSFSAMCSVMEQLRPLVILIFGFFAARLVHKTLMEI